MKQSETNRNSLQVKQERAVELLIAGNSIADTASELGVHRSTIYRWRSDPHFEALVNRSRAELRDLAYQRLETLQLLALDAVESGLRDGDRKLAVSVLQGTGVLNGQPRGIGPTDPEEIIRNSEEQARFQDLLDSLTQLPE